MQALIPDLGSRLGDRVAVGSSVPCIFLKAPVPDRLMRPHEWRVTRSRGTTSAGPYESSAGVRKRSGWSDGQAVRRCRCRAAG